jgi:hypothetical protein
MLDHLDPDVTRGILVKEEVAVVRLNMAIRSKREVMGAIGEEDDEGRTITVMGRAMYRVDMEVVAEVEGGGVMDGVEEEEVAVGATNPLRMLMGIIPNKMLLIGHKISVLMYSSLVLVCFSTTTDNA